MKRVLFLVAHPIEDAGCRYRVYQFLPYLENAGYECELRRSRPQICFELCVAEVISRARFCHTVYCSIRRLLQLPVWSIRFGSHSSRGISVFYASLENAVLRRSQKVMFSFDDAIYAGHHDVAGLNHPFLYRLKYGRGVDEIVRRCVHVVAGNRILGDYARSLIPRHRYTDRSGL